jgi:hypothetical protein
MYYIFFEAAQFQPFHEKARLQYQRRLISVTLRHCHDAAADMIALFTPRQNIGQSQRFH